MDLLGSLVRVLLPVAVLHATAFAADESAARGRKIFEGRCASCHEGAGSSAGTLGPGLAGIVGRVAGTGRSGVHSRAMAESGIVWSRASLRRFLADPAREVPGTIMPVRVEDPRQLEDLLNYLESMR
jgi:cytochrome c2